MNDIMIRSAGQRRQTSYPAASTSGRIEGSFLEKDVENGRRDRGGRRLVAIMHADVVDYSRLMRQDEDGTHRRLKRLYDDFRRIAKRHGGRIVGTAGDAVLVEFPSVIGALDAAISIQRRLAEHAQTEASDSALLLRVGINLGDVIYDEGDLFGDGVNIAQRIETVAPPGGIAVTASVREQVSKHRSLKFEDLGLHRVKNISDPLRVYALRFDDAKRPARSLRRALVVLGSLAFATIAIAGWFLIQTPATVDGVDSTDKAIGPLAGKPTVAVLPFADRGPQPHETWFADGVTEDVIAQLGSFQDIFVLSWSAVAPYRDQHATPRLMNRELGVRYLVSGSIARMKDSIRVGLQLTDAERGVLLWSKQLHEDIHDIFGLQAEIVRLVAGSLAVRVSEIERARAFEKPTDSLDAYDYVLRGRERLRQITRTSNFRARRMFERAAEIDPDYAAAKVGLGWTYARDFLFGWTERPSESLRQARRLTERAIELQRDNADAHTLMAYILRVWGDMEGAKRHVDISLQLNPNDPDSLAIRSRLLLQEGNPEKALAPVELAMELDPYPQPFWLFTLGQAYYTLGRYQDAVDLLEKHIARVNEDPSPLAILAASRARLGDEKGAAEAVRHLKRVSPFFDAESFVKFFASPESRNDLIAGLRKAGL